MFNEGFFLVIFRLNEDQLVSMFENDSETNQKQQQFNKGTPLDTMHSESWALESGQILSTFNKHKDPLNPSNNNSLSKVSNKDPKEG